MSGANGMVNSPTMRGSEGLGYGTQISVDGVHADPAALADPAVASAVLERMLGQVEADAVLAAQSPVVTALDAGSGLSAALVRGESSAVLHTFTDLRAVTLHLFSAHDLPLTSTTKAFLEAYAVGRFQSSVRAFGVYLPRDAQELKRALVGERLYARMRVAPPPTVTL